VITLDRAQSFALHRAATDSILVYGSSGTGKSSLANAIAVKASAAGLACLLVSLSSNLDKPLIYRAASLCHPILASRAQINNQAPRHRQNIDPLEASIRLNPSAMQVAARALRRARKLREQYKLDPDEVEYSPLAAHPVALEALDLIAVITPDATRLADMLCNRRSGRSLRDVETAIAGGHTDILLDEEPLALIPAEQCDFEQKLAAVLATATRRHRREATQRADVNSANPHPDL